MTVAVVIASTLGEPRRLVELLTDLASQERLPDEVVLAIQRSTDEPAVKRALSDLLAPFRDRLPLRIELFDEVGLSRNRNRGLELAASDICLLTDEDIRLEPSAIETVANAFDEVPNAVVITFRVRVGGRSEPRAWVGPRRHTWRTLAKVASPEIAVRRRWVMAHDIHFDVRFGLGAPRWTSGEENIFLADIRRETPDIYGYATRIGEHPRPGSAQRLDARAMFGKGALFARMYGRAGILYLIAFTLKKLLERRLRPTAMHLGNALAGYFEFWRTVPRAERR